MNAPNGPLGALAAAALAALANAGPLAPPIGPVESTYKTLAQVEPRTEIGPVNTPGDADSLFKISSPGSYYLSRDWRGVPDKAGIEIAADDVTIDLNGFTLRGVPTADSGITTFATVRTNIRIVNGVVTDWGQDVPSGIELWACTNVHVRDVTARDNGQMGIWVGTNSLVESCLVFSNDGDGIRAGGLSAVRSCLASANGGFGVLVSTESTILDSSASLNGSGGFFTSSGSVLSRCFASRNDGSGFHLNDGADISRCAAWDNDLHGFETGSAVITRCNASRNGSDGIRVTGPSLVEGNDCYLNAGNGAAGILVNASNCRLRDNHLVMNDVGIDIDGTGNFVVRNTADGNGTNYDIVAGNYVGRLVSPPASAAVIGDTGGSGVGTTDDLANFAY